MRQYISLLLFICSINIFAAKMPPAPQPEALQAAFDAFVEYYKALSDSNRNRMIEWAYWNGDEEHSYSLIKTIPFCCDSKDSKLNDVIKAFITDEKNCYQYVHETPGAGLLYSVSFGERRHITRQNKNQEFYMLCAKNPINPRFRNMYAIAFVKKKVGKEEKYEGNLFRVYSPRPDYKEEDAKDVPNWQKYILVGHMDKELKDSIKYVRFKGLKSQMSEMGRWRENVIDGRFVYKDKAYKDTDIQFSYIYKNGNKSDWQTIKITPGTTLYATFHKNSYEINRVETDYTADENKESDEKLTMEKAEETLKAYSTTLKAINDQIKQLRKVSANAPDYEDVKQRLTKLHKNAEEITDKMQNLVEKVAKELE